MALKVLIAIGKILDFSKTLYLQLFPLFLQNSRTLYFITLLKRASVSQVIDRVVHLAAQSLLSPYASLLLEEINCVYEQVDEKNLIVNIKYC